MDLNSPTFLFLFLPVFLIVSLIGGKRLRIALFFLFSLVFFIWGDPLYFPVSFLLAFASYLFLQGIQRNSADEHKQKQFRNIGVIANLLVLLFFKVLAAYGPSILNLAASAGLEVPTRLISLMPRLARMPLGLSFLAFQGISLLLDAPYETAANESLFLPASLHLLMFPKAISGPLVRFDQLRPQINGKSTNLEQLAAGLRRFMLGYAKKALIADQLALVTNGGIFEQAPARIPAGSAWIAIICYALQIYFDFAAYSDMAIGLAQALGFKFPENFNNPYCAVSITDFWRRWHMTLSAWFRDYVFYPLEKKRAHSKKGSQSLNILIVFLLTGLWHGITPPFIAWGLIQGSALVLENGRFGHRLRSLWQPLQHLYALLVILFGWVFFRSPSLAFALGFLQALTRVFRPVKALPYTVFPPLPHLTWAALILGICFSFPIGRMFKSRLPQQLIGNERVWPWIQNLFVLALFIIAIVVQSGTHYQPFIYGDF